MLILIDKLDSQIFKLAIKTFTQRIAIKHLFQRKDEQIEKQDRHNLTTVWN